VHYLGEEFLPGQIPLKVVERCVGHPPGFGSERASDEGRVDHVGDVVQYGVRGQGLGCRDIQPGLDASRGTLGVEGLGVNE
jgi:hypothetical protein